MDSLKFLLLVALLIYSLFSAVTYLMRRRENKQALRSLQQDAGPPVRQLTADERAALAPFLFEPARPDRAMPLQGDAVHRLEGAYLQHGLSTGQGGSVMHHTLGGVEVILPYDAVDYLEPHNRAEVVFGSKCAVVVTLNDGFELPGAHARSQRRQQQQQQWQSGRLGEVADIDPDDVADVIAAVQAEGDAGEVEQVRDALRVEILGQRDETPAEVADRRGPGLGLLAGLAFGLAFVGLAVGGGVEPDDRLYWLLPSLLLAALGAWWAWGPRRAGVAGKVNRVRGHVTALDMPLAGQTVSTVPRWFLGNKFPMGLPAHWMARFELPNGPIEAELRVADHSVVRLGRALSIDDEVQRFAPVYWGRHLSLALVGGLALAMLVLAADNLRGDLALSRAWLSRSEPLRASDPAAMATHPPMPGTMVSLAGEARCGLGPRAGVQVDCSRLHWGGVADADSRVEPDDLTLALHQGSFIHTRWDARMEMLMQIQAMQALRDADPLARYQARLDRPTVIIGLPALVRDIGAACTDSPTPACASLRHAVVRGLRVDEDAQPVDWAQWVRETQTGPLANADAAALARSTAVADIRRAAQDVAAERLGAMARTAVARRAGPGAVQLVVWPGDGARLLPEGPAADDALQALAWWQGTDGEGGASKFAVDGLVVEVSADASGVPVLHIDASRHLGDPLGALVRTGAIVAAFALLLGHGAVAVHRWRAAGVRRRAVAAYNEPRFGQVHFPG